MWGPRAEQRSRHMSLCLIQKRFPAHNHLEMKIYFSPRNSCWGNEELFKGRPNAQHKKNSVASLEVPCLIMSCMGLFFLFLLFYPYFSSLLAGTLHIYYECQLSVWIGYLSVQMIDSLSLVPSSLWVLSF
jgi:hypothetical protein